MGVRKPGEQKRVPVEEKSNIDISSIKTGASVWHKKFGEGKVVELIGDSILVQFEDGQKKFEFPSAFENGFLNIK